jgi:hypothetical protein
MAIQVSSMIRSSTRDWVMTLKTLLTAMMSLLSVLVFLLAGVRRDALWLWIGFAGCLVSGVFIQLFINRIKSDIASGRR